MASDDITLLADALSKAHVEDEELSYKGRGLKLDSQESGETAELTAGLTLTCCHAP